MKLCFSTVGCPQWRWSEITSAALDLGYEGIELRGLGEDLTLTEVAIFKPDQVEKTAKKLHEAGLSIPCVASDCLIHNKDYDLKGLYDYISLAAALKSPYIRVLCDDWGEQGSNVDEELCLSRLREAAPNAEKSGVTLLVESNGVWADTKKLRRLLDDVGSPAVAALWDINHPVRNFGETAAQTMENIGSYVRHIHVKDSIMVDGKLVYKMLGYGDLPLREALSLLKNAGYNGYLSMEWVKRWNDELEDPGVVFSHFVYRMKKLISEL